MKNMPARSSLAIVISLLSLVASSQLLSAPFTSGNLLVVQAGDGVGSLTSAAAPAFLKEYTPGGSLVQTIALPTSASGGNAALTLAGTANSEGFLTFSVNGLYLTMAGYNTAPGTLAVAGTAPNVVNRVVARIDLSGNIDTTTILTDAYSGSNIRSAVTTDGTSIWMSGNAGTGLGSTAATRYTTLGSSTSTGLHTTASNMRVVNIFNGQLYVSSSTTSGGGLFGVASVGTGLPTSGNQTPVALPGTWTSGSHSVYDFWFKDANTLYMADDGAAAAGGGIQKWTQSAGTWTLQYILGNNGTATTPIRGLAGTLDGSGNTVLYGTSGSALIAVTDLGASSPFSPIVTAGSGTAFRGVEFVPEPSVATLLVLSMAGLLFRRNRK